MEEENKQEKPEKCNGVMECQNSASETEHECPYQKAAHSSTVMCRCCARCEQDCKDCI